MKTILSLLLILASPFAFAAVEITDDARVLLDGKDIGDVTSSAKNGVISLETLQAALVAKLTEAAAKTKVLTDFLAKAKEAFNAGDFDGAKTILNPEITKAERKEKEKRKAELAEQIAKLQAEHDALEVAEAAEPLKEAEAIRTR